MTDDDPGRPQFKNFPRLKEAARRCANPSIFSKKDSLHDHLKFQNIQRFETPKKQTKFQAFDVWVRRNPRTFHLLALAVGLSIVFSRPLYDVLFRKYPKPNEEVN